MPLLEQLLVSGVIVGSRYALVAVSFSVIYATTRIFHLAHAVTYALAAYVAVVSVADLGLPLGPAAVVGLLAAITFGMLVEGAPVFGYRALRRSGASLLGLFLASLGLSVAAPNLFQVIFGAGNRTLPGFTIHVHSLGSANFTNFQVVESLAAWILIGATILFIERTKYGRAITAVRTNPTMSEAVGVSSRFVYLLVFGVGSFLVGIAGIFTAIETVAYPQMGLTPILIGFIAVFLGGIGSTVGAAVAGLALGVAANLSGLWLSSSYEPAVVFAILFLFLIIRPQGLFGNATAQ